MEKVNILGVKVTKHTIDSASDKITEYVQSGQRGKCVYTPNSEIIMVAYRDEKFKDVLNEADRLDILEMLKNPFEMYPTVLISIDCNEENSTIDFKVRRIARYKEPFSQIVLNDFMNYLSRQALPNDFS